jgi:hypothetical protein
MSSISAVTFNSGSTITGTTQVGDLAIGSTPQDYTKEPGGLRWWSSADLNLGYVIAHVNQNANQPNQEGVTGVKVGFWRTAFTDESFIQKAEYVANRYHTPETFTSATQANEWFFTNGYWTSYSGETPSISLTPIPTVTETPTITPTPTTTPTVTETPTITPTPSSTPAIPVTNNLVLYYDPSNTSSYPGSGTVINDLSGNGLNGTMSNITFTSPYFSYNGSSSQVSVPDNALLEPESGSWTMESWFYVNSFSSASVVLGKFDDGGLSQDVSYSIRINTSGSIFAQFSNGAPATFVNSTGYTVSLNTWYQVVYVWTNSGIVKTLETFINGVSIGTVNHTFTSILNSTNPLYLGSYNGGEFPQWFNGRTGISRLYNTALTSSQVLQNYNANKSKYGL